MKKGLIITLCIIAAVLIIAVGWGISTYNNFVNLSEEVDRYQSDIQTDLQRRNDLIPNLVDTVKAYASHEEGVFTEIADARARMMGASTNAEIADADNQLTQAIGRLFALSESYPELKANQNFLDLQTQLEGTENRISVARKKYNEAAKTYNAKIRRFPASIIAGMGGFDKVEYFEASSSAQDAPTDLFD